MDGSGYWGEEAVGTVDCLRLVRNLLRKNTLNQNYFRETSCIARLAPLLEVDSSDTWLLTDTKSKVVVSALEILFFLLSAPAANSNASVNQTEIAKQGMLPLVITWALDRINSPLIRSRALFTLGALLRHHSENRSAFAQKTIRIARESTPQPTLHRLLTLAFHSTHFAEQVGATFAFVNYMHENSESQLAIVTTLTPPPDSAQSTSVADAHAGANSIGRQLIKSLQEGYKQPVASWMASVLLASIISDNQDCKHFALRIQLSLDRPKENLLTLCMTLLRSNQVQKQRDTSLVGQIASIGFLRLLCVWMFQFPPLVAEFLSVPENLSFLVEIVAQSPANIHLQGMAALLVGFCFMFNENEESEDMSSNRLALHGIICHRIGLDKFLACLDAMRQSAPFQRAETLDITTLDLTEVDLEILLYDSDLIEFVKNARDQLLRDLRSPNKRKADIQYKDQIREKDALIEQLQTKITELESCVSRSIEAPITEGANPDSIVSTNSVHSNDSLDLQLEQALAYIQELQSELASKEDALQGLSMAYNDLEAHLAQEGIPIQAKTEDSENLLLIGALKEENEALQKKVESLSLPELPSNLENAELEEAHKSLHQLKNQLAEQTSALTSQVSTSIALEETLLQEKESRMRIEKELEGALNSNQEIQSSLELKTERCAQLEEDLAIKEAAVKRLEVELVGYRSASPSGKGPSDQHNQDELREWKMKFSMLEQEQEDLLIMLAKEEIQNATLQERLSFLERS